MERVFFVKNGDLAEVNNWLQKGAKVKSILAVPENVSSYGYSDSHSYSIDNHGAYRGDIAAYFVLEFI